MKCIIYIKLGCNSVHHKNAIKLLSYEMSLLKY